MNEEFNTYEKILLLNALEFAILMRHQMNWEDAIHRNITSGIEMDALTLKEKLQEMLAKTEKL